MSDFVPKTLEVKDKSIDNAVFRGIQEMGLSLDEVEIVTVQEGTKGILGIGAKPYIVRLTQRDPSLIMMEHEKEVKAAVKPERPAPKPRPAPPERRTAPPSIDANNSNNSNNANNASDLQQQDKPRNFAPRENTNYNNRTRAQNGPPRDSRAPQRPRPQQAQRSGGAKSVNSSHAPRPKTRREEPPRIDNTVYTPYVQGQAVCPGADFLAGLLIRMDITADLGYFESDEAIKFKINSKSMGILIGHRGETLDAMQYLTSLVVNRGAQVYRRVTLDTENYRNKREDTLVRLANKIASQVKKTGEPVELEPMNPYERRVLHATLQNHPYIETYSEGEEPKRRVVIAPKKR